MARRLPTLLEVLRGESAPPVDLHAFYAFLYRYNDEYALDFWFQARIHTQMCLAYTQHSPAPSAEKETGMEPVALEPSHSHIALLSTDVQLTELVTNAQSTYERYFLAGEHELVLPNSVRQSMQYPSDVATYTGDIAELASVFKAAEEYVFVHLQTYAYPAFLQRNTFSNMEPLMAWARFSVGLFIFWIALTVGFAFVFTDTRHATRVWILLPTVVAMYFLVSYMYTMDPILALLRYTEMAPFHMRKVEDGYIAKQQRLHAMSALLMIALLTAAFTVLFVFVPGHHL
ncbi:Bud site selection protein, Revert to axial protein 1 [Malassezia vespertilionis]|uniref:Rax1p n=1 Tax=Malassezia vespertilionis TaxID=2020962 RepID=A0A2N1JCL2_9BASI|nr:Bud site selection protein, Revert to axial protein 1 [Malassezia vespertilionis]PKI84284.1 Rax1p [Malassezia vespertilionis]WFD06389.1 Bud site selection protein, Revert to axial protein 1 [Malassezia vespertilionis]